MENSSNFSANRTAEEFTFTTNTTGDLVLRFVRVATRDTPCEVIVRAAFVHTGWENSFLVLEESGGASVSFGGRATVHAGPVDLDGETRDELMAWEARTSGPSWGTTAFTVAVRNMTWWENDFTGPHTLQIEASCDEPFMLEEVRGSHEVRSFRTDALRGGLGAQAGQFTLNVQDDWSHPFSGEDIHIIARGYAETFNAAWDLPDRTVEWSKGPGFGERSFVEKGPAGAYALRLDSVSDRGSGILAVIADLPLIDSPDALRSS